MERWKRAHRRDPVATATVATATVVTNGYHPSFSSSLLDAIDRSIDDKGGVGGGRREGRGADAALSGGATKGRPHCAYLTDTKQYDNHGSYSQPAVYSRGVNDRCSAATGLMERRYNTTTTEKVVLRRPGAGVEYDQSRQHYNRSQLQQQRERFLGNSTSSSSESSYGGFSSSEAESVVLSAPSLPKPVRTSVPHQSKSEQTPLEENKEKTKGSIRNRFRASKLYGELKKSRPPVSPGARLASFLNTLFSAAGNPKKAKISTNSAASGGGGRGGDESACSSASSYSRSCLSKTPSSRGKAASSGGESKRSVRFYPVSVIVDEDCRPCGQKCLYEDEKLDYVRRGSLSLPEPPLTAIRVREALPPPSYPAAAAEAEERKRAREAARGLICAYKEQKRSLDGFVVGEDDDEEEEDDDDDDAASCSSSDLFELKSLVAAGSGEVRYRDELPVYETTHLQTNRAIAQGLLV